MLAHKRDTKTPKKFFKKSHIFAGLYINPDQLADYKPSIIVLKEEGRLPRIASLKIKYLSILLNLIIEILNKGPALCASLNLSIQHKVVLKAVHQRLKGYGYDLKETNYFLRENF